MAFFVSLGRRNAPYKMDLLAGHGMYHDSPYSLCWDVIKDRGRPHLSTLHNQINPLFLPAIHNDIYSRPRSFLFFTPKPLLTVHPMNPSSA